MVAFFRTIFGGSLELETSESIKKDLSDVKNPISMYKKAMDILSKMEQNFGNALSKEGIEYSYFDGNVDTVDAERTEFEKKAKGLKLKIKALHEKMNIGSALYALGKSKLGISSIEQQELDSLVQDLLQTQERAKALVEDDLKDGRLDSESHVSKQRLKDNLKMEQSRPRINEDLSNGNGTLNDKTKKLKIHEIIPSNVSTATLIIGENNNYNGMNIPKNTPVKIVRENDTFVFADEYYEKGGSDKRVRVSPGDTLLNFQYAEPSKNHDPVIEAQTKGGNTFKYSRLEDYNPPTSPKKIPITDPKVKAVIEKDEYSSGNFEKTQTSKMIEFINKFLKENPDILGQLGISDIRNISPSQAIRLSATIVTKSIDYDEFYAMINGYTRILKRVGIGNDALTIDELLIHKKGVCRNYAEAVKTVFITLQKIQNPETTQLNNTYCKVSVDNNSWDNSNKSFIPATRDKYASPAQRINMAPGHHAWNSFYTVSSSGNVQALNIDATWADEKGKNMKNPDFTDSRFLFDLERMVLEGLLTQEQKIAQLEKWCGDIKNQSSPSYRACTQEIGDYYLRQKEITKGLEWYFKSPSLKDVTKIQETYNIPKEILDARIQDFVNNPENQKFTGFVGEYFYKLGDYKRAIDYLLVIPNHLKDGPKAIMLVYACIQCGNERFKEQWKSNLPLLILKYDKPLLTEEYPKEAKAIISKYEPKQTLVERINIILRARIQE